MSAEPGNPQSYREESAVGEYGPTYQIPHGIPGNQIISQLRLALGRPRCRPA